MTLPIFVKHTEEPPHFMYIFCQKLKESNMWIALKSLGPEIRKNWMYSLCNYTYLESYGRRDNHSITEVFEIARYIKRNNSSVTSKL